MKKLIPLLIIAALLLSACSFNGARDSDSNVLVYRLIDPEYQTSGELLYPQRVPLTQGADPITVATQALASGPSAAKHKSPLPSGVHIVSVKRSGSNISVRLNSGYGLLSGMDKTILDAALAMTYCSLDGVEGVSTYVGEHMVEENLRSADILLENTVKTPTQAKVRLYYPAEHQLSFEYRSISIEGESSAERAVAEALLAGPKSTGLYPALPTGTVLLSVYTQEGVCSVSLSEDFVNSCSQQPENATYWVYSLVNTLCSLYSVSSVQLLIEGKATGLLGDCDVSHPLIKNEKLIGSHAFQD